jgi:hypothetical protein
VQLEGGKVIVADVDVSTVSVLGFDGKPKKATEAPNRYAETQGK